MRRSAAEGRTILFATHYLEEADQVADRVIVLDRGRIVADGTGRSIKGRVGGRTIQFETTAADAAGSRRLPGVDGRRDPRRHGPPDDADADDTVRALFALRTADPRSRGHRARPRGGFPRPDLDPNRAKEASR